MPDHYFTPTVAPYRGLASCWLIVRCSIGLQTFWLVTDLQLCIGVDEYGANSIIVAHYARQHQVHSWLQGLRRGKRRTCSFKQGMDVVAEAIKMRACNAWGKQQSDDVVMLGTGRAACKHKLHRCRESAIPHRSPQHYRSGSSQCLTPSCSRS